MVSLVSKKDSFRIIMALVAHFDLELHEVDYMKAKEKNLIAMAREVEVLRAEILNAEKRVNGSFLASVCHSLFM